MKTINKIRKMLGNRYHLSVEVGTAKPTITGEKVEITKWVLYRNYENGDPIYWSDDNKPIMRSEENTIAELYDFAKSHQRPDLGKTILKSNFWILTVVLVICFANFYLKSDILRGVVITADIIVLLTDLIIHIVSNKNHKVNMRELAENWIRRMEELKK